MTMTEWIISGSLGFIGGGVFIWFCKTAIQTLVIGANALSAKLHADADVIAATVKKA
jgi:hypothetical protein